MNRKKWLQAAVVAAVGVTLGVAAAKPATGDGTGVRDEGKARVTQHATPSPTPGPTPKPSPSVTRSGSAKPKAGATTDDGSQDARQAAGWAIIQPGTPAARYWQRHGVGTADDDTSGLSACEAALRVQYVRGYVGTTTDGKTALWQVECQGVTDVERDSLASGAIEWGSTHGEGDG